MFKDIVFLEGVSKEYQQSIINFIAEWESQSPIIEVRTSGTTGSPKTFQFTKEQAIESAKKTGEFFHFKQGDSLLLNLSIDYIAGKLMVIRALVYQLKLVVAPLNSNPLLTIKEFPYKIKLAAFVPMQVQAILSNEETNKLFNQIEYSLVGGASFPKDLENLISKQRCISYASFGMTETLTHFALRKIDGKTQAYTTLPNVSIQSNERNCLTVLSIGITDTRVITNDIVELINERTFIWKGRLDNMINSGGVKIFPEQDELLIKDLIPHSRYYLTSENDLELGEKVILKMESIPLLDNETKELLDKIKLVLPKHHAPKKILFETQFKETKNGKLIRERVS